jgi:hypothetical protein
LSTRRGRDRRPGDRKGERTLRSSLLSPPGRRPSPPSPREPTAVDILGADRSTARRTDYCLRWGKGMDRSQPSQIGRPRGRLDRKRVKAESQLLYRV